MTRRTKDLLCGWCVLVYRPTIVPSPVDKQGTCPSNNNDPVVRARLLISDDVGRRRGDGDGDQVIQGWSRMVSSSPSFLPPASHPSAAMDPPTLESIPPEILTRVAFFLAVSPLETDPETAHPPSTVDPSRTVNLAAVSAGDISSADDDASPPSVCPAPLVPLLSASRAIHNTLTFSANPHLYARVFEDKFDTAAVRRRLGCDEVHDGALAHELRTRCVAMRHLKEAVARGDVARFEEQDVYTVYLMLLENGKSPPLKTCQIILANPARRWEKPQIPTQPGRECTAPCVPVPLPRSGLGTHRDDARTAAQDAHAFAHRMDHLASYFAS